MSPPSRAASALAAVCLVAGEGKIAGECAGCHNLAVALDSHGAALITASEIGNHRAAGSKGEIRIAVDVVPDDREVVVGGSSHHDLAVDLDGHGRASVSSSEVGGHQSADAECLVQVSARRASDGRGGEQQQRGQKREGHADLDSGNLTPETRSPPICRRRAPVIRDICTGRIAIPIRGQQVGMDCGELIGEVIRYVRRSIPVGDLLCQSAGMTGLNRLRARRGCRADGLGGGFSIVRNETGPKQRTRHDLAAECSAPNHNGTADRSNLLGRIARRLSLTRRK